MRVMICAHPGLSHFLPMATLGWTFRAMGADVVVAIADCAREAAAISGLDVVEVAPDFDMAAVGEWVAGEHPGMAEVESGPMLNMVDWAPGLAGVNRPLVAGVVDLADAWHPDVVLYDQPTTVGLLAAQRCGAFAVQQNLGAFRTEDVHARIAGMLADLYPAAGEIGGPAVTLEFYPPSLLPGQAEGWFRRWVPFAGGSVRPVTALVRPDRNRIVVSMGTTELQAFGLGSLDSVLGAVAGTGVEAILAVGDVDVSELGRLPSNVQQVPWTPLESLLRPGDVLVHHGGGGNVMTAIAAGVPQLIAHDPANLAHQLTVNAVNQAGIGIAGSSDSVDAGMLTELLGNDRARRASIELQAENAGLPAPAATAAAIAALVD